MKRTPLTEMVIRYQNQPNNVLMKEIIKQTNRISKNFIQKGKLATLPQSIKEELLEVFNSIALVHSLQKFDRRKGTQFSTIFIWELRHYTYLAAMYNSAKKRTRINLISLDTPLVDDKDNKVINIADVVTNYNIQVNHTIDKFVKDVMNGRYTPMQKEIA